MAITTGQATDSHGVARPPGNQPKKAKPILWWAALGGALLLLEAIVIGRWIASGPTPTDPGPSELPTYFKYAIPIEQFVATSAVFVCLWFFLIKPWRREGHVTLDGLMSICFLLIYWQDPFANYTSFTFSYNAHYVNFGSWAPFVPGWVTPNMDKFAEPILSTGGLYLWAAFVGVVASNAIMRKLHARWPQLGKLGAVGFFLVFFWIVDTVFETAWMAAFMPWQYLGEGPGPMVAGGTYFQFPIWETFTFGTTWAVWAMLRYFRNDRGETFVERGSADLNMSTKKKAVIRLLALNAAVNMIYLVFCNMPYSTFWAAHQGPFPEDITSRSYLLNGICGQWSNLACPDPTLPNPRKYSSSISPDGQLQPPTLPDPYAPR